MTKRQGFALLAGLAAVAVIGAGCKSTTTIKSGNTNTSVTTETNISVNTNSATTGTFSTNTATNTSTAKTATVTIAGNGVSPQTLTVDAGTTVTFKNNDSSEHQVASDSHPTHTDYPGFDSRSGIAPGGQFSFTFTKVGSWGYHDHLNSLDSSLRGTIIVR